MALRDKVRKLAAEVATQVANQIADDKLRQVNQVQDNSLGTILGILNQNQLRVQLPDGSQTTVTMINSRPVGIGGIVVIPTDGIAI